MMSYAEDGVFENKIVIGQTIGISGDVAGPVKEMLEGSQAYFDFINKSGGIHGRKIELKILDDEFNPLKTLANTEILVKKEHVFALFQSRGTPHTESILPILTSFQIPLIAPITGSSVFYEKKYRYLFNTRAKYQDEIRKGVEHFFTMGIKEVSLIYVNDAFGIDGLTGFNKAMSRYKLNPIAIYHIDRVTPNIDTTVNTLVKTTSKAVIVVSSSSSAVEIIKNLRVKNSAIQIMTLSNNSSQSFVNSLGSLGYGIIVSQIMPAPHLMTSMLGQEFKKIAQANGVAPTYAAMEGFVTAKVLVEGLKRSGSNPTRSSLIRGLETMRQFDLGGLVINYDEQNHDGSEFIELTIISKTGQFLR
ncbi:ABC transporter substrate-binding protein [Undibacterium jejuense]|uniref:ABC transporter substrate-binding protein n=1 Tax=Undibacterium jejuense TaxID=1344949 RepID=A0A923HJ72_9BURK|nr:ABC transporter substrate-binding protein [Undibacterium jejuense]MBC3861769.1 ABC transporter substrate-binding protein [Undibacterium jejuense]